MCLILFAHRVHPDYPLVLAANRDELYERPTLPAAPWPEAPGVVAGRDVRAGGTWLGVRRGGRWAAVTNHRGPLPPDPAARSRGGLVSEFLLGDVPAAGYVRAVEARAQEYNGFNLLVGDADDVFWISNRGGAARRVEPGVHGLSNALLDTPWPKVRRGRAALARLLQAGSPRPEPLLEMLLDRTLAADHELPRTGVGPEHERLLSPAFILSPDYGTRSSSALLLAREGGGLFVERSFVPGTLRYSTTRLELPPG